METIIFRSKVDALLAVTLLAGAGFSVFVAIFSLAVGLYQSGASALFFIPVLVPGVLIGAGLPLWVLKATRYELTPTQLRVFCGPFAWSIAIKEIRGVSKSTSFIASPALSLKRLKIEYGRDRSISISPKDEESFVSELEARGAAIKAQPTRVSHRAFYGL